MLNELILIRHGKAESKKNAANDFDRTLTQKGEEEFSSFTPELLTYLSDKENILIWTSPLVRAKQTAAILTTAMEREEAKEKEFIATGDFDALLDECQILAGDYTVICVGHKPYLGNWAEEIIGSPLSFSKGEAAAFQFDTQNPAEGKLIWKKAPGDLAEDEETADVRAVLAKQAEKMEEAFVHFANNPYEPETTHKIRVHMRRMRSLLNFLKPVIGEAEYRPVNDELKEAADRLGPLREIDVLIQNCTDLALEEPQLVVNYADVFKYLHVERRRLLRTAVSKTTNKQLQSAIQFAKEKSENLPLYLENTEENDWNEFLTNRLEKKMSKLKTDYKELDATDQPAAHQVRINAKKIRYAIRGFGELMDMDTKNLRKKAKKIQNELGVSRDYYKNAQLLQELADEEEKEDVQEAYRTLSKYAEEK